MVNYRNRIQAILQKAVKSADLQAGSKGFVFLDEREVKYAYESAWRIPTGYSFIDVRRQQGALTASCGAIVELEDRGGAVIVRVVKEDFPKHVPLNAADLIHDRLLVGYNRRMDPIYHPLNTHLLVGGASRSGKTDWLRFIVYQLHRQGYDIQICDLKGFSFFPFEGLPRLTIAKSLVESLDLLGESYAELEERKMLIQKNRSRAVIQSFQPIVVIIDEAASLSPSQNSGHMKAMAEECDNIISVFGQQGREPRIFMIYSTQRPDADVVNKQFKANVEASIAFRCKDEINSRIILGRGGAEDISPDTPGRCIYSYDRDHLLQVPYIGDDDAWEKLLKTDVVSDGKSERKAEAKRVIDAEYRPADDHDATCETHISGSWQPGETNERTAEGSRGGKMDRGPKARGYAQGVAARQTGKAGGGHRSATRPLELPEDSALVDDW
jgi:S-DNA-T family DNA segregation ATPase FtsK/SpoIIIE